MNKKEWDLACKNRTANHHWDGACRRLQRSLQYNSDPNAIHRHHLRDTKEQRKYNDEHYELWGFEIDENGNEHFEYGKYIIFVTPEEHSSIHSHSEETRSKISESLKGENNPMYGKPGTRLGSNHTSIAKEKISEANSGKNNGMYGKTHTDAAKSNISNAMKRRWHDEEYRSRMSSILKSRVFSNEHRRKLSESKMGEKNAMFGTHHTAEENERLRQTSKAYWTEEKRQEQSEQRKGHFVSDETKTKISSALRGKAHTDKQKAHLLKVSEKWKEYKSNGGTMTWNEFQKANRLYDN